MGKLGQLLNPAWWRFEWRYLRRSTPWDTRITPPEVIEYIRNSPPGCALDLGCGTGTNAITLTRHGWRVTGVDFSAQAIAAARKKAAASEMAIDFHVGDVSDLGFLTPSYDYLLDIGCLFSLQPERRERYAAEAARLLHSGADFMLYAWLPRKRGRRRWGISAGQVSDLFQSNFVQTRMEKGKDGPGASAWYWMTRK